MDTIRQNVASDLLKINAIKLSPNNPFTWASGWNSPIYCDNRKTLSYPDVRANIRNAFCKLIKDKYPNVEVIAGVATGAIAQGVLVAEQLGLPFIYIRSSAKAHGMGNQIEGEYKAGQKVVVIEDLVSTGGSSLKAVDALREAGCDVLGMLAIFTYGFPHAKENFKSADCSLDCLSDYEALIDLAVAENYVDKSQIAELKDWREAPDQWRK